MPGRNIKFSWTTRWEDINRKDFQDQWSGLYMHSDNPNIFMHPSMCKAWMDTYRKPGNLDPYFIEVRKGSSVLFFPMVIRNASIRNAFISELIPVGFSDFDYNEPIYVNLRDKQERQLFWTELSKVLTLEIAMRKFDVVKLSGIREELTIPGFKRTFEPCPRILLDKAPDFRSFMELIPGKLRKEIGRRRKRLSDMGKVEFRVLDKPGEITSTYKVFLDWHRKKWPRAYRPPGLYESMIREAHANGFLHFSVLRAGFSLLSIRLCFYDRSTFYSYIPVYNPDFAKFSPGKLHLLECIRWAMENRLTIFDHMRGLEPYKTEWADEKVNTFFYSGWNPGLTSSLKRFAIDLKNLRNRF